MLKLIVFLGNPGHEYARTRHNVGRMVADSLPGLAGPEWQVKFKGRIAPYGTGAGTAYLLKPDTFMNRSGESVFAALQFYKYSQDELLVVHDELELPFGEAGFRKGGGLAGHNGLRSIVRSTGRQDFFRFRIGISRPSRGDASSHVLGRFSPDEEPLLPVLLGNASRLVEVFLSVDPVAASSRYANVNLLDSSLTGKSER